MTRVTDTITINRKQFDRAMNAWGNDPDMQDPNGALWRILVAEASRREPIVAWAIEFKNGIHHYFFDSEATAKAFVKRHGYSDCCRIVRLVEQQEDGFS